MKISGTNLHIRTEEQRLGLAVLAVKSSSACEGVVVPDPPERMTLAYWDKVVEQMTEAVVNIERYLSHPSNKGSHSLKNDLKAAQKHLTKAQKNRERVVQGQTPEEALKRRVK